jgi:hypothetical protein
MIKVSSVKYNNELRTSQDLNYLLACIGEKVTITTEFYYEDICFRTEDNLITLKPDAVDVDLSDTTGIILSEDGQAFTDTYVGDTIGVSIGGACLYYTVLEKFDNGMIRTTYAGVKLEMNIGDFIFNSTAFNGLKFAYNLVESGSSFESLIDGEYQQLTTGAADCTVLTPVNMAFTGILSYQIGSATLTGMGGTGGTGGTLGTFSKQSFKIIHSTVITPFFLESQYADLLLGIKPDYFKSNNCLNYIGKIQLGRNLSNPNALQTLTIPSALSNIGWFNERFNGGVNNYSLSSLVLTKGAATVNALEFDTDITVEATIVNTVDSPFVAANTQYIFGFNYLPDGESDYQNNGENQTTNFLFDSKRNVLSWGSLNGANYGTSMQVIKTLTSTFISSSSMKITAVINIGADAKAILQQGDFSRYQMWLITEKYSLNPSDSNKVNLLLQVSDFELNLTTSDIIESDGLTFIQHPYQDDSGAVAGVDINVYPVDDIVANLPFHIDFTSHTASEGIKIKKIQSKILLKDANDVESDITFEDFSFSTAAYPIIGGQAQNIAFSQDRVFKIPTEIQKTILCERDFASDSGDDLYFTYQYPFMQRWEYWESLAGIVSPPNGIFDNTKPLNGLNHLWYRFTTVTDWHLWYDVIFTIEQNGVEFTQTISTEIKDSNDYDSNAEWTNNTIKSYDITTDIEIESGGVQYIKGYEDVKIKASFEKVSGGFPTLANVGIVIWIETYENGGISSIRRISSFRVLDSQSWFKSTDTSDKIVVTNPSIGVYVGTCLLDYTKLPTNADYTLYARIYDFFNPLSKQFEDGDDFEFETGGIYEFETV